MATVALTKQTLESTILDNDLVLIDFWASWCGPCRAFGPIFEAASEQYPEAVFAKVDTEDQQELAGMFGITSIPTLMVFREKVLVFAEAGALPAPELGRVIDAIRALDMTDVHQKVAESKTGVSASPAQPENPN